jgi:hypothetical protein
VPLRLTPEGPCRRLNGVPLPAGFDELITWTYSLDQINQGNQDMRDGKNLRGVILY